MSSWTKEKVFHSGDNFYRTLETELSQAKHSILLETYIFRLDSLGNEILALLQKAAARGVRVKILVDGFGSYPWSPEFISKIKNQNLNIRIFHPFPYLSWKASLIKSSKAFCKNPLCLPLGFYRLIRNFKLQKFLLYVSGLNHRDHRKLCVIDGKMAFLGGMNISDLHLKKVHGDKAWRDSGIIVEGPEVKKLIQAFYLAWITSKAFHFRNLRLKWNQRKGLETRSLVKLNDTVSRRRNFHKELISRILKARRRIWITSPYFIPDVWLLSSLRVAAYAGLDVRILLPRQNDILIMKLFNRAFYWALLRAGVRIYEYLPSVLHAKITLIDHYATIGSSNRNFRSLLHDLEVDVILKKPSSIRSIEKQFLADVNQSEEIVQKKWRSLFFNQYWLQKLVFLFRKWL